MIMDIINCFFIVLLFVFTSSSLFYRGPYSDKNYT